ncbi:hypothetical protein EVB32_344 [Rhizobium phage RHph_TM39]|uniref:Uncharacterized protein n=1 Tax=Rhizobium phage RHph_TM30 TaxID=2509764 RepID=A0A7S5R5F1_9CAUD|nr:hypothetical protein PQC16_gp292 [Rhizobium phage RHph_TM30]QIG71456.1 hypothetical protein EVB93_369 [Rhizobium phage RHph_TM30]QIG72180.1 hypothetical protein EVB95_367 [Rhizobium phage RHph_TM2_3B]QIG72543.1 hypothetical protein EVB96_367 [Rhizobium phage RHph_TM3_3_6]QIG77312.1 hypothetical protein EVB32_344 [Rhizobium phage RHph_TM39]
MPFLKSIDQLREVQWGTTNLWDIRIPSAPSPFNAWFPAVDITENRIFSSSFTTPFFLKQYKFPQNSSTPELQMTFADSVKKSLSTWLQAWHDEIYDDSDGVMCIDDAAREIIVCKLDTKKNIIKSTTYFAYPDGNVQESLNSQADLKLYSVAFNVVGHQDS